MSKLFLWCKKIHRLLVLIIVASTLIMAATGILMKYQLDATGQIRYVHNQMSIIFTVLLSVMAATGLFMYFFPLLIKRKNNPKPNIENPHSP